MKMEAPTDPPIHYTLSRLSEKISYPLGAVTTCQAIHKIALAFTLVLLLLCFHIIVPVLANRIPLFMESYSCLLSVMTHCGSHPPWLSL